MDQMAPTANAVDKLKYTPGINVSSSDATGLSGTSFTMRGMNSDQVGLSSDGFPINDSGDYAIYPNLMGDSENFSEVFVTQGSSEADGPHIGPSGGNIGLVSMRPTKDFGVFVKQSVGSNNLRKSFARLNTGDLGGFKTWVSASHTEGDKWKGKGHPACRQGGVEHLVRRRQWQLHQRHLQVQQAGELQLQQRQQGPVPNPGPARGLLGKHRVQER